MKTLGLSPVLEPASGMLMTPNALCRSRRDFRLALVDRAGNLGLFGQAIRAIPLNLGWLQSRRPGHETADLRPVSALARSLGDSNPVTEHPLILSLLTAVKSGPCWITGRERHSRSV